MAVVRSTDDYGIYLPGHLIEKFAEVLVFRHPRTHGLYLLCLFRTHVHIAQGDDIAHSSGDELF